MQTTWAEQLADIEGSFLKSEALEELLHYAESFSSRRALYQMIMQHEMEWITHVLRQNGYDLTQSLSRSASLLAEQLARCLRLVGTGLLMDDQAVLSQVLFGSMDQYLDLVTGVHQLFAVMMQSLTPQHQALIQPYREALISQIMAKSELLETMSDQVNEQQETLELPDAQIHEEPLTLMEMFA